MSRVPPKWKRGPGGLRYQIGPNEPKDLGGGGTGTQGPPGADGRACEFQNNGTYIQWRYEGDTSWTNLVALTAITGPQGPQGPQGDQGPQGNAGTNGTNGTNGVDGKTVRSGSGAPSAGLGADGDVYFRTDTNQFYGPKASGAWGSPVNLVGPAGTNGSNGSNGINGTNGLDLTTRAVAMWQAPGNGTAALDVLGAAAATVLGTATARTVATTNRITAQRRIGYVSAATAAALCGARSAASQWYGSMGGNAGYTFRARFVPSDAAAVSGARMFVGVIPTAAPTNVEPNTLLNVLGVCQLSTGTNLQLIRNDGTGTATTVDLGANFPAAGASNAVYELTLTVTPGSVAYSVVRLDTGDTSSGTWTTDIPADTTLMGFSAWRCNNATALACGIDIAQVSFTNIP